MRFSTLGLSALLLTCATPAFAQEETAPPEPVTVSGSVTLASDYRFRGVSQSDKGFVIQGGATVAHESGVYGGFWGSNLAGWGTFGGPNLELDLFAGFKTPVGDGGTLDIGATWYMYPDGANTTDFIEPYVKLSGTAGPVSLTAGIFYAPPQEALGRWYFTGADAAAGVYNDPGDKEDNLYLSGDAVAAIPNTPISLRGHIGYSDGNPGLGPNGTSVAPTGQYWDYAVGADLTYSGLTFGVTYVGTDISDADGAYLLPNFSKGGFDSIADGTVVFSLTAAF
ncbi:TorF family putative porin [Sphingomonas qomolangmaensis]|uniref:TorF family putative porin n=1 Tax=Sphingomonas qomolangmaensis TaxID=2918765 RepID=A0ABY5L4T9_9SPHN|nr:TorF family putative porin [Sphingomonas qomolangmaensis]UUL81502.1 TorF family putative porin [Sphingomonas qomolangmaensis]